jgi:hypothetical protein
VGGGVLRGAGQPIGGSQAGTTGPLVDDASQTVNPSPSQAGGGGGVAAVNSVTPPSPTLTFTSVDSGLSQWQLISMTENTKQGSNSGYGWAPAKQSLDQILRQISLEEMADKMGRLFVPTSVINCISNNTAEPTNSWGSLSGCTTPPRDGDGGGETSLYLDNSIGGLSWAGDATAESTMPEVTIDTPPPEMMTSEDWNTEANVVYNEEEKEDEKNSWKVTRIEQEASQKKTPAAKESVQSGSLRVATGMDCLGWPGAWNAGTARNRTYFLYELPLFSPPRFKPPTAGGEQAFSDSVSKWNNRRLPVFLLST